MSDTGNEKLVVRGEDLSEGVRDWLNSEIKAAPARAYDLGKFFFGVSVGTLGLFLAIERLSPAPAFDWPFWVSGGANFTSLLLALWMVFPRTWRIGDATDLFNEHRNAVNSCRRRAIGWCLCWFICVAFAIFGISN